MDSAGGPLVEELGQVVLPFIPRQDLTWHAVRRCTGCLDDACQTRRSTDASSAQLALHESKAGSPTFLVSQTLVNWDRCRHIWLRSSQAIEPQSWHRLCRSCSMCPHPSVWSSEASMALSGRACYSSVVLETWRTPQETSWYFVEVLRCRSSISCSGRD